MEGLHRRLSAAIVPVATYVIATEPVGAERIRTAIGVPYAVSDNRFSSDYYRALADTRILWGGRISARRSKPARLAAFMLADLLKVYPQLEGVKVESAWDGLMSYAVHKMPQIGQLSPGLWYAMGFGGSGMGTTTVAGELVSSAIAEGDDRYRLFEPFGLIPPTGGPVGVAAAQLTYWSYQLQDAIRERAIRGRRAFSSAWRRASCGRRRGVVERPRTSAGAAPSRSTAWRRAAAALGPLLLAAVGSEGWLPFVLCSGVTLCAMAPLVLVRGNAPKLAVGEGGTLRVARTGGNARLRGVRRHRRHRHELLPDIRRRHSRKRRPSA